MIIKFKNGDEFLVDHVLAKLECVWIVLRSRKVYIINKVTIENEGKQDVREQSLSGGE